MSCAQRLGLQRLARRNDRSIGCHTGAKAGEDRRLALLRIGGPVGDVVHTSRGLDGDRRVLRAPERTGLEVGPLPALQSVAPDVIRRGKAHFTGEGPLAEVVAIDLGSARRGADEAQGCGSCEENRRRARLACADHDGTVPRVPSATIGSIAMPRRCLTPSQGLRSMFGWAIGAWALLGLAPAEAALVEVALVEAAEREPGFGGASEGAAETDGEESVCMVQGEDGAWHPCSDFLRPPAPSEGAETQARAPREREQTVEEANPPPLPAAKTRLELEIEKAQLDPSVPLLALRIEVARAEERLALLESRGQGGPERKEAEDALESARGVLDDVEKIALHRMDTCAQRRGNKPIFKSWRMTAGGPVVLSAPELMAQLPLVDPAGCERIGLIDDKVVARVRRARELRRILETKSFGYHQVGERRALEEELQQLDLKLKEESLPALHSPGVRDPY